MERNSFSLKLKSVAPDRTLYGCERVYNNVDLKRRTRSCPRLHPNARGDEEFSLAVAAQPRDPIGSVTCKDSSQVCWSKCALACDPTARKMLRISEIRIIRELSISYDTVKHRYDVKIRELSELRL